MSNTGSPSDSEHIWRTESLRFTLFPLELPSPPLGEWWSSVVGHEPDIDVKEPKQWMQRLEGEFLNGRLILTNLPGRIDWCLVACQPEAEVDSPVNSLGPFAHLITQFTEAMRKWLGGCPSLRLQRIALGAVLLRPVPTREDGYAQLVPYLPHVHLDGKNSWDFFYQINRRRTAKAGAAQLYVNRLCRWSVAAWRKGALMLAEGLKPHQLQEQEFYACRLELDLNTPAENATAMERDTTLALVAEMRQMAFEIAHRGDTP